MHLVCKVKGVSSSTLSLLGGQLHPSFDLFDELEAKPHHTQLRHVSERVKRNKNESQHERGKDGHAPKSAQSDKGLIHPHGHTHHTQHEKHHQASHHHEDGRRHQDEHHEHGKGHSGHHTVTHQEHVKHHGKHKNGNAHHTSFCETHDCTLGRKPIKTNESSGFLTFPSFLAADIPDFLESRNFLYSPSHAAIAATASTSASASTQGSDAKSAEHKGSSDNGKVQPTMSQVKQHGKDDGDDDENEDGGDEDNDDYEDDEDGEEGEEGNDKNATASARSESHASEPEAHEEVNACKLSSEKHNPQAAGGDEGADVSHPGSHVPTDNSGKTVVTSGVDAVHKDNGAVQSGGYTVVTGPSGEACRIPTSKPNATGQNVEVSHPENHSPDVGAVVNTADNAVKAAKESNAAVEASERVEPMSSDEVSSDTANEMQPDHKAAEETKLQKDAGNSEEADEDKEDGNESAEHSESADGHDDHKQSELHNEAPEKTEEGNNNSGDEAHASKDDEVQNEDDEKGADHENAEHDDSDEDSQGSTEEHSDDKTGATATEEKTEDNVDHASSADAKVSEENHAEKPESSTKEDADAKTGKSDNRNKKGASDEDDDDAENDEEEEEGATKNDEHGDTESNESDESGEAETHKTEDDTDNPGQNSDAKTHDTEGGKGVRKEAGKQGTSNNAQDGAVENKAADKTSGQELSKSDKPKPDEAGASAAPSAIPADLVKSLEPIASPSVNGKAEAVVTARPLVDESAVPLCPGIESDQGATEAYEEQSESPSGKSKSEDDSANDDNAAREEDEHEASENQEQSESGGASKDDEEEGEEEEADEE
ncbi:uncharacterized protein BcabD6B2_21100 [Babesia caballi]|uniref:Uncharacterized protein n=1 Tax=Babesia caballi TaxID=5871 RepID=A0AAV4LSA7_BABCB|nr:hypothetical protein, conserved [Babesia caballi]